MQTFGAFLVSVLAAGMVAAAPADNKQTARVDVIYNKDFVPHGPTALHKAYLKHNRPISDKLKAAVARKNSKVSKRQTGSATNKPTSDDEEYLTPVSIGTPAQTINLDFDTGSSDLWVFSSETSKSEVGSHKIYTPSKSSTSKKLSGSTWSITYQDRSKSNGDVYTDKVTIGGFTVNNQAVEAATSVSSQFTQDVASFSGLLGLAFDNINTVKPKKQKTWFSNAAQSLASPLFTANLKHQADGTYNFGFIDTSEAKGKITYTDVDSSEGFWTFESTGYGVGTTKVNRNAIQGIADTGTTLLLLDDNVVDDYYNNVQSAQFNDDAGGISFDCSENLPSFSFGIGSSVITVPGSYINFGQNDDGSCFGGIQSDGGQGSVFGDVALKAALVVFDLGNERLGWAQKA